MDEARPYEDELAAEGYQAPSADTGRFEAEAWPLAQETWPHWEAEAEWEVDGEEGR